ncbi:MAG: rhodanese-like domain-containing protein [Methylocystaceae bacterium]|nr:rhodanese-like domain-containing protein [Methylocystaceae bacterium]
MKNIFFLALFGLLLQFTNASAQEVGIGGGISNILVETEDGPIKIERIQDTSNVITGDFAKTSRPCPPFCIQPMKVADGVETYGERELIDFLKNKEGVLVDARTENWHLNGTIPSSVNIPYVEITQRMDELGCQKKENGWDCSKAKKIALYCNGPWCGQSPMAIKSLLREGYPASLMKYYRGGMQAWQALGLTVVEGSL